MREESTFPDTRKHNRSTYTEGCRCKRCKKAAAFYQRQRRQANADGGHVPDHVHGSANGYTYWGCRCIACMDAYGARMREFYDRRKERAAL